MKKHLMCFVLLVVLLMESGLTVAAAIPQGTLKIEEIQQLQALTENSSLTNQMPAVSNNKNAQNYRWYNNYNWNWAETVKSYLYENQNKGITRVEYIDGQIVVEDYNNNFQLYASQNIPVELPIWGGFFAGESYNFVVFGQENPTQDDNMEVVRVVKYSKTWERLGQASLYGANTTVPFEAGSLRCAEYGDYLYIRTCHKMYKSSDGLNHQANLTMAVRQSDMTLSDSYYIVMNSSVGYVSHSFNQFVLVDQNQNIVTLDHGDAYPRGIVVMRYHAKAGGDKFSGRVTSSLVVNFSGQIGNNYTGAAIGGFAETESGYVTAFNYNGVGSNSSAAREVYIGYTAKDGMDSTVNKITESTGMLTPVLVSTGLDGGVLMWNDTEGVFYYVRYNNKGEVGSITMANAELSDCQPICQNEKIVWYVTSNSVPKFFVLDLTSGMITMTTASKGTVIPINEIKLDKTQLTLNMHQTETLIASILPEDATNKTITWSSSNPSVVTVENGKVTALKEGTATITVTSADKKTAVCIVTVINPVSQIKLNYKLITLGTQQTETLIASILPEDATDKTIIWSSSNPSIASVENGKVTGLQEGIATITAASANGKKAVCKAVVVTPEELLNRKLADVFEGSWQYEPALYVYEKGIMTGKGTDNQGLAMFAPDDMLTREQFAQILYSAEGKQNVVYSPRFKDLTENQWYTNAVIWAAEQGIVSGYKDGRFGVGDNITREQLALMLYKYAQIKEYDITGRAALDKFTDASTTSDWAEESLQWAVANRIMSGKGEKLDPAGNATRAECAAMLKAFMTKFETTVQPSN